MGQIAKVNNIEIWWEDYGDKSNPSVLLIQGANATCMDWPDQLVEELVANDLHVVIFDNRDVGKSTWINGEPFFAKFAKFLPSGVSQKLVNYIFKAMVDSEGNLTLSDGSSAKYDLNDMAKDAIGLMDYLQIDKAHIVGASMGGMIAQIIALEYSDRALTLIPIMSSPGMGDPNLPGMTVEFTEKMKQFFLLNMQGEFKEANVVLFRGLSGSRFSFDEAKFRLEMERGMTHGNNPYAGHGEATGASPYRKERLHEIKTPTLVIHGSEDPILPVEHGLTLAENIPNAKKYIMEGVGHEMPEQMLSEIINEMLNLFNQSST